MPAPRAGRDPAGAFDPTIRARFDAVVADVGNFAGLPPEWLGGAAHLQVPSGGDEFKHQALRVAACPVEHMLAMQLLSPSAADLDTSVALFVRAGIRTPADAADIYRQSLEGSHLFNPSAADDGIHRVLEHAGRLGNWIAPESTDVAELRDGMSGTWLVHTRNSIHAWDLENALYERRPRRRKRQFHVDNVPQRISRVERWPRVGDIAMVWLDEPSNPASMEVRLRSSPIYRIGYSPTPPGMVPQRSED